MTNPKRVLAPFHVLAMVVLWVTPPLLSQSEDYLKALASVREKRYLEALVWIQKAVAAEHDKAAYYLLQARSSALCNSSATPRPRYAVPLNCSPIWPRLISNWAFFF